MKTLKMVTLMALPGALIISAASLAPPSGQAEEQFDFAATYKSKCVACHGKKAEKKFNDTLADQELIDAILKGKKAEKPPNMPAYADKGINADQAKALVDHMKALKSAP